MLSKLETEINKHQLNIEKLKKTMNEMSSLIKTYEDQIKVLKQHIKTKGELSKDKRKTDRVIDDITFPRKDESYKKLAEEEERKKIREQQYTDYLIGKERMEERKRIKEETMNLSEKERMEETMSLSEKQYYDYIKEKPRHEAIQYKLRMEALEERRKKENFKELDREKEIKRVQENAIYNEPRSLNGCWHNPGGATICTPSNAMNSMVYNSHSGIYSPGE